MRIRHALAAFAFLGLGLAAAAQEQPTTAPAASAADAGDFAFVRFETTSGTIDLLLDRGAAPVSAANFLQYVDDDFYAGTIFHRVIDGFMIQGGGFTEDGTKKPVRDGIWNEWRNGLTNVRGSISMARVGGQPNSGSSQFFINVVDNAGLDQPRDGAAYAVFGTVVDGFDVVDAIRAMPTGSGTLEGGQRPDVPLEAIVVKSAKRIEPASLSPEGKKAAVAWEKKFKEARDTMKDSRARHAAAMALLKEKGQATDSGLRYAIATDGDGAKPVATDTVTVVYTGWFPDGHQFDSSLQHPTGPTATFPLNRVIPGWTEGVALMPVGARYVFEIPGDLAYGPRGGRGIPANQTLIFEVQLEGIGE